MPLERRSPDSRSTVARGGNAQFGTLRVAVFSGVVRSGLLRKTEPTDLRRQAVTRRWTGLLWVSPLLMLATSCGQPRGPYTKASGACCTLREQRTMNCGVDAVPIELAYSLADGRLATAGQESNRGPQFEGTDIAVGIKSEETTQSRGTGRANRGPCGDFRATEALIAVVGRGLDEPDRILLLDVATGRVLWTIIGHTGEVSALAFSPDDKVLLTCGATLVITEGWEHGEVKAWDLARRVKLAEASRADDPYRTVAFLPGGEQFVTGLAQRRPGHSTGHQLAVWNSRTCEVSRTSDWAGKIVTSIACVPGTGVVVAGSNDGFLSFWDARTLTLLDIHDVRRTVDSRMYVTSLDVSSDGKKLAVCLGYWIRGGGDGELQIWDIAQRKVCCVVSAGSDRPLTGARFSPNAESVAGAIGDGTVRIWNLVWSSM